MRYRLLALACVAAWTLACGAEPETAPPADAGRSEAAPAVSSDVQPAAARGEDAHDHAHDAPRGRPLPAFSGYTLDDARLDVSSLIGRRLLIFFFNPDVRQAVPAVEAVNAIADLRGDYNFEVLGIATAAERPAALAFVQDQNVSYRVIDDSSAKLAQRFGLRGPVAMLAVDAEGYLTWGSPGFATEDPKAIETILRGALRLPGVGAGEPGRPQAPDFQAVAMDGGERFELAAHKGKPLVLIFFLHTCPHCHAALRTLETSLDDIPEESRPAIVGIEVTGRTHAVRSRMQSEGLDFFPVYFDDDGSIQSAYGVFGGVPDLFFIDADARITARMEGWHENRDEPLARMRLAKLAGGAVPMLLRSKGYSGSEVCGVCHELEHETWNFTTHAGAFDTLVKHGADNDPECIGCHVVGWEQPGGFRNATATPDLEDVGCETCHGRGGPHLSPKFVENGEYGSACIACHDDKHSLGFEYATFVPRVSHAENAKLVALPPDEKARLLAERGRPGGSLLPTNAGYVGSDACRSCHAAEFETWTASPHARAIASLETKGKSDDAACLACHTTAMGRPGGFPEGAAPSAHADLARVGCESCHGPGSKHVAEGANPFGSIVSLGDKCDSCVILQICGACHDQANDPGFQFEVQEKIDRQRHGTTEPGTSRPKDATAAHSLSDAALLAHAFRLGEPRPPDGAR